MTNSNNTGYDSQFIWDKIVEQIAEKGYCRVFHDKMAQARLVRSQMGVSDAEASKSVQRLDRDSLWLEVDYAAVYEVDGLVGLSRRVAIATRDTLPMWHIVEWRDEALVIRGQYYGSMVSAKEMLAAREVSRLYSRPDGVVFYKNYQSPDAYNGWIENALGEDRKQVTDWTPN